MFRGIQRNCGRNPKTISGGVWRQTSGTIPNEDGKENPEETIEWVLEEITRGIP